MLFRGYSRSSYNLVQGKNTVEIEALNQGESGPNTAEFIVYDDQGKIISSKEWNLLTGVKAIIVFKNEKAVIKEKASQEKDNETNEADEASNN